MMSESEPNTAESFPTAKVSKPGLGTLVKVIAPFPADRGNGLLPLTFDVVPENVALLNPVKVNEKEVMSVGERTQLSQSVTIVPVTSVGMNPGPSSRTKLTE